MAQTLTVAEALVLRKHLEAKVEQLRPLKAAGDQGLFELKTERRSVSDNIDEVKTQVPKITLAEITKEFDTYSKALREIDTAIQKSNWQTKLTGFTVPEGVNV